LKGGIIPYNRTAPNKEPKDPNNPGPGYYTSDKSAILLQSPLYTIGRKGDNKTTDDLPAPG
jgi:hypothetical protein